MGTQHTRRKIAALHVLALVLSGCFVSDRTPPQVVAPPQKINPNQTVDVVDSGECSLDGQSGECTRDHAVLSCEDGGCVVTRCLAPYADCDFDPSNGCETSLDEPENCGLCGTACRYSHAAGTCDAHVCNLDHCEDHFGNCDGQDSNGCERSLTTLSDCGECGKSCSTPPNATADCKDRRCSVGVCLGPYGDCDGKAANGCEQPLNTREHCGKCDGKCDPAHGEGSCESGACVIDKCEPGFADCNGLATDGCETALDAADDCGACGNSCKLPHVAQAACEVGGNDRTELRCVVTHACDPNSAVCTPGALDTGCERGFADCDKNPANGCEADLSRSTNCGGCGVSCAKANTTSECREGKCVDTGCTPGSDKCGGDSCKSLATDPQNCGQCGRACTGETTMCAGGRCTGQMCTPGQADCDGEVNNGCEVSLNDDNNCGTCGLRCPNRPHAIGQCRNGMCGLRGCELGWKDCDGDPNNGCEVNIGTLNDCGDCQRVCVAANAETACSNGQCQIIRCGDGRGNCNNNLTDGCESDFSLPATCGGCNNVCASLMDVVSSSCEAGKCNVVCGSGRANCDGMPGNGCEADLSNPASCGRCDNNCMTLPNVASATCNSGACGNITCRAGFADCNGDPSDGCERSLNSTTDCGACNSACAPAHGAGQCDNGTCRVGQCDSGFADCNARPADGCEQSLSVPEYCGGCTNACKQGTECLNGSCGCGRDEDCGPGGICCSGRCGGSDTACFVWPCNPGMERSDARENCGGCGQVCLLWCCTGSQMSP